jgi:hypothetical protein
MTGRSFPRWPLAVIALPAAVAIWSGWVGLGMLCGFGPVHVLPGIDDGFVINTAITLPVGMEAYAAYALAVWFGPYSVPDGARQFARRSAIAALCLGMLGQVTFHLLSAAHATAAPWLVVMGVSCIPVGVLGFAVVLTHKLRAESLPAETPAESGALAAVPADVVASAKASYAATVAAGNALSRNQLQAKFRLRRIEADELMAAVESQRTNGLPH